MWLFLSLLHANDVLPCVSIFNYLKLLLLLNWNNLGWSIHMLRWFILWHMAQSKYAMWHLKMNLINKKRLVGTKVGANQIRHLLN